MKGKGMPQRKAGGSVVRAGIGPAISAAAAPAAPAASPATRKSGGAIPARKTGGVVQGRAAGGRLDKRARGGRMTPSSPLSGASAPNLGYAHAKIPKTDAGGKGKDK